jgi:acyl-CoA dehydrogenase
MRDQIRDDIPNEVAPNGSGAAHGAMSQPRIQAFPPTGDLWRRAQAAVAVAARHADVVDAEARFPHEAFSAVRAQRLLGILVPSELGGEDASVSDVVDVCYALGRACGSTAMIYAMHQIMVACLVRHARGSAWHVELLRRLAVEQLLLASSTTDGQGGGDLRKSDCAVVADGARIALTKSASVISYGAHADGMVTTARRTPDAPASDQVLVAFIKDDYRLQRLSGWDALGMRGTCSAGFMLDAQGRTEQVLPDPYRIIHAHTVMPVAHLTWSAVWAGIAASAVERARRFVREAARKHKGQLPPGAAHLTRATATLQILQAGIAAALRRYESALAEPAALEALEFQTALNLLKVNSSELAISAATSTLQACGLAGYRNDGDFSVSRALRDALSSSIMINNDRILGNVAGAALLVEVPALLTDSLDARCLSGDERRTASVEVEETPG